MIGKKNYKDSLMDSLSNYQGAKESQSASGLAILPLVCLNPSILSYISLHEALAKNSLIISEVSEGGSVPNLMVQKCESEQVLILEGEELQGAKQNRILNTTVLIGAGKTIIPVSCTERGRWSYSSRNFRESGNKLSPSQMAFIKQDIVFQLAETGEPIADQCRIWNNIEEVQKTHNHQSKTSALADVYEHHGDSLNDILSHFPLVENQCGIYARIDGRFAGFDLVSKPEVWKDVHNKIIRSYAMEVVNRQLKSCTAVHLDWLRLLARIKQAEFTKYDSLAHSLADDIRFETPNLIGSALMWYSEAVHMAAYPKAAKRNVEEPYHHPRNR